MEKSPKTVETEKTPAPGAEATPFAASWDVFYQDAQGLECHLQVRAPDLAALLETGNAASLAITEAGGKPSRRMTGRSQDADKPKENGGNGSSNANNEPRDPTYVDERGTRRCNRRLTDGSICGRPVTEKEGRYGAFWSCPNYKSHVPVAPR